LFQRGPTRQGRSPAPLRRDAPAPRVSAILGACLFLREWPTRFSNPPESDLAHTTDRVGSPQTLVRTKTQASDERQLKQFELDEKYLAELEAIAAKAPSTAVRLSRYSMSILKRADRGALVDGPRLVNLDLMVFRSCDAHALHFENS
jgi:hypothetical protein